MPTYDYVCQDCGHEFELFQQMSAPVERICPECGQESLKRLVGTGGGILFKGSGFYETDYRSDSYRKAADSDKQSSTSSGSESKGTPDGGSGGGSESASGGGDSGGKSEGKSGGDSGGKSGGDSGASVEGG